MEIITDTKQLSDRKFVKSLRHGVYVMQNSRNPYEFCVGAVGTTGDSVLRRLQQHIRLARGWKPVFFVQFLTARYVYPAEAVLFGKLCSTYRRKTHSEFIVSKNDCSFHYVAANIQRKANNIMDHFGLHDYTPEGLGLRSVDAESAHKPRSIRDIFAFPPSYPTAANRVME